MNYKINEIFYSIQTEGHYSGTPAVFVRFSGCNLQCTWCDTKNHNEGKIYTKEELEKQVINLIKDKDNTIIVFTGGEPTLQLKEEEELLKGYYRCIETNGILKPPSWINWITCSPKTKVDFNKIKPDEVKYIYDKKNPLYSNNLPLNSLLYLQPLELNGQMNYIETIEYIKKYPKFRFSLQYHKIIGIR